MSERDGLETRPPNEPGPLASTNEPKGYGTRLRNEPGTEANYTNEPKGYGTRLRNEPGTEANYTNEPKGYGTRLPNEPGNAPDYTDEPEGYGTPLPNEPGTGANSTNEPERYGTRLRNEPGNAPDSTNEPKGYGTRVPEASEQRPDSAMLSSTLSTRLEGGSAIATYQDMMVGSRSWLKLLQHELLVGLGGAIPGALGLAFRKVFWKGLFAECGGSAVFGRGVVLRQPLKMKIGARLLVDDDTLLDAKVAPVGGFVLGDDVLISRGCTIVAAEGPLRLGNHVSIGNGCTIMAGSGVEIGDDTMLAAHCYIGGGTYQVDARLDQPMRTQPGLAGKVVIGPDCWLGAGAIVISGVTIGRGAVIGAGALVARDVPDHAVVTGVPAKVRRLRQSGESPQAALQAAMSQ
ncbi:acyltransferase [Geminicoccus roseus]|uniref:acyltransferase n=1 Tax=Geminicoccus roseus TaxID=404900 RepID=UPI00041E4B50|nr:acyltransferase [Geminicoccus roseus]